MNINPGRIYDAGNMIQTFKCNYVRAKFSFSVSISISQGGGKSRPRERLYNSFKGDTLFLDDLLLIYIILNVRHETNDQFLPTHLHATDIYITAFSYIYSCKIAALAFRIQNTIKGMTKT